MNSNFPSIIKGKHFHLVGIKGTGMAALAELLAAEGALVTGSDVADVFYTDEIIKRLGVCAMSFDSGNITDDVDCVVHSSAYSAATNADLIEATKRRLPIVLYTEALGAFSQRAYSVGICGVHGKTSTTGLVGTILHRLPMASAALAGSVITSFGAPPVHSCVMTTPAWGTMSGGKRYFAAETCEYQRHFMSFHPQKIILTSVESDHQDYYPTYDSIIEAFVEYLCLLPIGGEVIYCADDEGACLAVQKVRDKRGDIMATPYGFTADGDYRITLGGITEGTQHFSLSCLPNIELHISGKHEVLDAAAAVAAVRSLLAADGRDARHYDEAIRAGVADFAGGKRRSEVVAHCMVGTNDTIFIDDYGHHPTAIRTTLAGFRQFYPGRRIIVDFMSHTYTRTAALLEEFASAFDNADDVVINKIYGSAREGGADVQEMTIDGAVISGKILAERAKKYHKHVVYAAEADEAARVVRTMLEEKPLPQYPNGCLFVTMGAGDNWKVGQSVIGELCRK